MNGTRSWEQEEIKEKHQKKKKTSCFRCKRRGRVGVGREE
jgi:hypothetical protein